MNRELNSFTIQGLKQLYRLTEEQMAEIRKIMRLASEEIRSSVPHAKSNYERRMIRLLKVPEGDWEAAEVFAEVFSREKDSVSAEDVFNTFYRTGSKFRNSEE